MDEEESTAAAEAVEARDPGVFRLRQQCHHTNTNHHTHRHGRVCAWREGRAFH